MNITPPPPPPITANSNNSKESWQTINELLNRKPKTTKINQIIINDKAIVGDKEIANKFNEYFSEIGKKTSRRNFR